MAAGVDFGSKREALARGLLWSGASALLSQLPQRSQLLVLNYHRIGNPDDDLFDPGVFSATAEQFNDQISYLKRRVSLATLEEALAFVYGNLKGKAQHSNGNAQPGKDDNARCRVLITFDDGYRDNYDIAYPILRSHGVQGVFFLATSMVGSCHVPWWDQIAYLVKTARRRRFSLRFPSNLAVDIEKNGLTKSLQSILRLYKQPENSNPARFIRELAEETQGEEIPATERRFLSWDEAREMASGGMAFGSHTHSHTVLSQLEPRRQFEELTGSLAILKERLGVEVDVLAYPVGGRASFTDQTQNIARDAGYRAAFSFYGGTNLQGKTSPYDLNRIGISNPSMSRFRVQAAVCRSTGNFWP